MRGGGTEGERADKRTDQKPAILLAPADGDLHADRIDSSQQDAGCKTRKDRGQPTRLDHQQACVEQGSGDRAESKEPPRVDPVGEAKKGRRDGAEHEADLDGAGESGLGKSDMGNSRVRSGRIAADMNHRLMAAISASISRPSDRHLPAISPGKTQFLLLLPGQLGRD